jgi:hypothetical protein
MTQEINWHSEGWIGDHPINCRSDATHIANHPIAAAIQIHRHILPNQAQQNKNVVVRYVAVVSPGVNSKAVETP